MKTKSTRPSRTSIVSFRVTPELAEELDYLREAFGFSDVREFVEASIEFAKSLDQALSKVNKEPNEWNKEDIWGILVPDDIAGYQGQQLAQWVSRWVKVRWGTAGLEKLSQLAGEESKEMQGEGNKT